MGLTARDKAIIKDLERFRVLSRDDIAELHFQGLKRPKYAANNILLRLLREGHIERSTAFVPYVYFPSDSRMKKDSAKMGHFLAIVQVYKEIRKLGALETFLVEPKYGVDGRIKGNVEPDIFCIFRKTPFFIEVQKSVYSEKQMSDKISRYADLYLNNSLHNEPWQPSDKKIFPHVLILSDQRYNVGQHPFKIIQAQTFTQFLNMLKPKEEAQPVNRIQSNLKMKIN
jgi:hypothetical protein